MNARTTPTSVHTDRNGTHSKSASTIITITFSWHVGPRPARIDAQLVRSSFALREPVSECTFTLHWKQLTACGPLVLPGLAESMRTWSVGAARRCPAWPNGCASGRPGRTTKACVTPLVALAITPFAHSALRGDLARLRGVDHFNCSSSSNNSGSDSCSQS